MKGHKELGEPLGEVHPNAAGLDIGSREIWACVPADRDADRVLNHILRLKEAALH